MFCNFRLTVLSVRLLSHRANHRLTVTHVGSIKSETPLSGWCLHSSDSTQLNASGSRRRPKTWTALDISTWMQSSYRVYAMETVPVFHTWRAILNVSSWRTGKSGVCVEVDTASSFLPHKAAAFCILIAVVSSGFPLRCCNQQSITAVQSAVYDTWNKCPHTEMTNQHRATILSRTLKFQTTGFALRRKALGVCSTFCQAEPIRSRNDYNRPVQLALSACRRHTIPCVGEDCDESSARTYSRAPHHKPYRLFSAVGRHYPPPLSSSSSRPVNSSGPTQLSTYVSVEELRGDDSRRDKMTGLAPYVSDRSVRRHRSFNPFVGI